MLEDILGFVDPVQLNVPFLEVARMGFLGSCSKLPRQMLVIRGDELLRKLIPFVQPLDSVQCFPVAIQGKEGNVDGLRILVHELLCDRTATRLGVGLLVDTFEDSVPGTSLAAGINKVRSVAVPVVDPLRTRRSDLR